MKLERIYAQALARTATKASDADGLIAHLKERGRLKLLPGILRELNVMQQRAVQRAPTLEVASEGEKTGAKKEAADLGVTPDSITVNKTLIRGWRARTHGTLIDRSGKSRLVDLYRHITK